MLTRPFSAVLGAALIASAGTKCQSPKQVKWDVISVKPMSPDSCKDADGGGVRYLPDGLSASCVSVDFVTEFAWQLMEPARIIGLPKWTTGPQVYAIEARVSEEDASKFEHLKRDEKSRMMQSVLAQRFNMKAHMETRELPAYALVIAKGGPKLTISTDATSGYSQFGSGNGEVKWVNSRLTDLTFLLGNETGRPVVDKTGLTAKYDFVLNFTPSFQAATDETNRPSIFTALEEQIGLKLVPSKEAVDVLVIESVEHPSEN